MKKNFKCIIYEKVALVEDWPGSNLFINKYWIKYWIEKSLKKE